MAGNRFPSLLLSVALSSLLLAGCLGDGEAGPAPLTVLAEVYNVDDDPRPEVVLDFYFTSDGKQGIRVDADGDLNLARGEGDARNVNVEYEPIGAVRVEIRKDDRNWIGTDEHGDLYRHVMNDHHFEDGSSYVIGIDLRGPGQHYSSKATIHYTGQQAAT